MYIRSLPPMLPIQYGSLSARTLPLTVLIIVSMNNIQLFFFFKQKTAYEMELWTGVQTCALPIYLQPLRARGLREALQPEMLKNIPHPQPHLRALHNRRRRPRIQVEHDHRWLSHILRLRQRRMRSEERRVGEEWICRG